MSLRKEEKKDRGGSASREPLGSVDERLEEVEAVFDEYRRMLRRGNVCADPEFVVGKLIDFLRRGPGSGWTSE